jgi:hypothetical protein
MLHIERIERQLHRLQWGAIRQATNNAGETLEPKRKNGDKQPSNTTVEHHENVKNKEECGSGGHKGNGRAIGHHCSDNVGSKSQPKLCKGWRLVVRMSAEASMPVCSMARIELNCSKMAGHLHSLTNSP